MSILDKKKEDDPLFGPIEKVYEGTRIEEGITCVGNFECDECIDILGKVEGDVICTKDVHVAKTGFQKGKMEAANVEIEGNVDADIFCKNLATFGVGSVFTGELTTVNFGANRGSLFKGKLNLIDADEVKKLEAAAKNKAATK